MSMHGTASATVTDHARALVESVLGETPTIVVDDLKGDASKGEPVTNGTFNVVDEKHPVYGDVVRNRVVKLGDNVVYGPVLVAAADKLTHAKAETMLRSFAAQGGWPVRPVRETTAKAVEVDEAVVEESGWARQERLVKEAVASFPAAFRLRGYPGEVFCVSPSSSYWGSSGPMVYTARLTEKGWADFAKGTPDELRRELCPLDDAGNPTE